MRLRREEVRGGQALYSVIASLDGYVADEHGDFAWAAPDEEVHAFVNDLERSIGTHLFGRRMYEVMVAWETWPAEDQSVSRHYAELWQAADKVVYSTALDTPSSARTRIERRFDPAAVQELVAQSPRDVSVGGPHLAAQAIAAGLVDECHLFLAPVVIGGGTPALPRRVRWDLDLLDEQRFTSGFVHLHYRSRR